jgi:glycosyltransferase involved in cell wall biosynthesis
MKKRLVEGKGAPPDRVTVIHNWADASVLAPGDKRNGFSREHGLADRFVVMHSGNMGLSQNLDVLLDAASSMKDAVFLLIGDGARKSFLQEQAHRRGLENVRFLPYQPRELMRDSYATADVFLISLKSGLAGYIVPSKLYGILAAGRPYVAAVDEDSEVAAVAREHECGLLAAPGDPEALVRAIEKLRGDPELARRLGENARRASHHFERRGQVRAYHDLFTRELGERDARADAALETSV